MKPTPLIAALLVATTTVAYAAPRHVLVLRAEGNADAAARGSVDGQIAKLAKSLDGNIELGEISFTDAAAAVGCSGSEAQCRDEVLGMMGVDELVSTTVTAMPSGDVRILVHRIPKGAATRDAQTTVPAGQSLDAKIASEVGPMFGVKAKPGTPTPPPVVTNTTTLPPPPPATTTTAPPTTAGAPVGAFGNVPGPAPAPVRTAQLDPNGPVTGAPTNAVALDERRTSRATTGLAIGGGLVVLSVILWAEASSVQGDINAAPTTTPADFRNLKDLEAKGDAYSGLGNLTFLGGLVVGGISGYFFWKDRRAHHTSQARLVPTLVDHGIGLAFTYGAVP
ncbi:MAG: hypothetical protein ABI678_11575 [Kofleriaceae bacterium]